MLLLTPNLHVQESTLDATIISQDKRLQNSATTYYCYEYELNSTRGRKRVLDTVAIRDSRLYIANAQYKCGKEECTDADKQAVQALRDSLGSFELILDDK